VQRKIVFVLWDGGCIASHSIILRHEEHGSELEGSTTLPVWQECHDEVPSEDADLINFQEMHCPRSRVRVEEERGLKKS